MRRYLGFVVLLLLLGGNAGPAGAAGDASTKLARGASNLAFGWFEIFKQIGNESDRHGLWIGVPSGLVRGAVATAARMTAGAYEVITFPFPNGSRGYEPLIQPESVFKP